jgi:hypothetical protein
LQTGHRTAPQKATDTSRRSTARLAFQDENEVRFARVVAGDYHGPFGLSVAGLRIQLQSYGSLTAGRDRPVEMGDRASSAGKHLLDVEHHLADVAHAKLVDDFAIGGDLAEIVARLGDLDRGTFLRGARRG